MRTVTFAINNRCPLSCAHCCVGFSETDRGSNWRREPAELRRMIESLPPETEAVVLAGGEPTVDRDLIKLAADVCDAAGITLGIISAPIWAATPSSAERLFQSVGNLGFLILSYDKYHLDQVKFENYCVATQAAAARKIDVIFYMAYATTQDFRELQASLAPIQPLIKRTMPIPLFPTGNAVKDLLRGPWFTINSERDLGKIRRTCNLGHTAIVDHEDRVHGCCWSATVKHSPFSRDLGADPLGAIISDLEADELFQTVSRRGFIDALSAEGRADVVARLKGQAVTQECELCVRLMAPEHRMVWRECSNEISPAVSIPIPVHSQK
jgi:organic radical activating enzyme